jgi:hypothetical protein
MVMASERPLMTAPVWPSGLGPGISASLATTNSEDRDMMAVKARYERLRWP